MSDHSAKHGSPWLNQDGVIVHPSAPGGAGGSGRFSLPGNLGQPGNDADPVRHPLSPNSQQQALSDSEQAELAVTLGVKVIEPKRNAPPKTVKETFSVKRAGKPTVDFKVEVKADGKIVPDNPDGAKTVLDGSNIESYPVPLSKLKKGQQKPLDSDKVVAIEGEYAINGFVTLQVQYGSRAKATSPAAWGRGTTKSDRSARNTTVGFHESKHLADFKNGLKTMLFPAFTGKVGMTVKEFNDAISQCSASISALLSELEASSRKTTDEVGDRMSVYEKKHPGSTKGH